MVKKKYNEATNVASSRSRLGKKGDDKPIKTGAELQLDFLKFLKVNLLGSRRRNIFCSF